MKYSMGTIIITIIGIILFPVFILFSIVGGILILYDVSYGFWYASWPFFGGMLISLKFMFKSKSKHIFRFYFLFILFIIIGGMSFVFAARQISKIKLMEVSKKIEIYLQESESNNHLQDEIEKNVKLHGMAIYFPVMNQYDIYILSYNEVEYYNHDKKFIVPRGLGD